jgi:hypothetical protein
MKLLSVITARTIWLIEARELNPRGRNLRYTLIPALTERYSFLKYPPTDYDLHQETNEEGMIFQGGNFKNAQGEDVMVNLTILDDGIVAETRSSTTDSDDFLLDSLQWASKELYLTYNPEMVLRKGYVSELTVLPENTLNKLDLLEELATKLSSLVSASYGLPVSYHMAGLMLAPDPTMKLIPASFQLERKLDKPFSENKYYSRAPLPTELHLQMLIELEQLLSE